MTVVKDNTYNLKRAKKRESTKAYIKKSEKTKKYMLRTALYDRENSLYEKSFKLIENLDNEIELALDFIDALISRNEKKLSSNNYSVVSGARKDVNKLLKIQKIMIILYDLQKKQSSIVARTNRKKQNRIDPAKSLVINEAIQAWAISPSYSLDDIAEKIRLKGLTNKSQATIKSWIAPHNPKRKNKNT